MKKYIIFFCVLFSFGCLRAAFTQAQLLSDLPQDSAGTMLEYPIRDTNGKVKTLNVQFLNKFTKQLKTTAVPSEYYFKIPDSNVQFLGAGQAFLSLLHSSLHGYFVHDGVKSFIIDRSFMHGSLKEWRGITTAKLASIFQCKRSDFIICCKKKLK